LADSNFVNSLTFEYEQMKNIPVSKFESFHRQMLTSPIGPVDSYVRFDIL